MKSIPHWWYRMPMLRMLLPLLTGIFTYSISDLKPFWLVLLPIFVILYVINTPLRTRLLLKGISISCLLFVTGYLLCHFKDVRKKKDWFAHKQADKYIIQIMNSPSKNEFAQSMFGEVKYVLVKNKWINTMGTVRIQVPLQTTLSKETVLLINKPVLPIPDTGTRKSYARYLANQNIFHQVKLSKKEILILDKPEIIETHVEYFQRSTLGIMDNHFHDQNVRGLAKALLVGYRGELDKELNAAYTNTGVVHVIAISGLHLGLIYGLLMLFFKPLQHHTILRIISCLITIILLWFFTLMCGATPSVVRSAIMFSFIILGNIIQSKSSTGNMLAASAFVMLAINPFLIYDIGFQLSYAAVASLLMYNKSVSGLFEPENGFLQLGWSSISTSLSAQILTTPLVLFHFHQFPLIFILSNIIAIPLSSIALLLLILICIFASFPLIATSIASITGYCIWLMNDRIIQLASLPFSTLNNIPFSAGDLLLSLISIGLFTFYLKEKNTLALKVFLITLLFWSILYHNSS